MSNERERDASAKVSVDAALAQVRVALLLARSGMLDDGVERIVEDNLRELARQGL